MHGFLKTSIAGAMVMALSACGGSSTPASSAADTSASAAATDTTSAAASAAAPAAAGAAPAAAAAGAAPTAFAQCQACHSIQQGQTLVGPSLFGVFGRKAGTLAGFTYSDGVKGLGVSWDETTLDKWLTNPAAMAPGTKMTYPGLPDATQRKAVIDYLKTLK